MADFENNNIGESIELINNEINNKLCNLEEKCNHGYALGLLDGLDDKIKTFDLDLAYDSITKQYRYISQGFVLDRGISTKEELEYIGNIISIIYTNTTYISGDISVRTINIDEPWIPEIFEKSLIQSSGNKSDKNKIEDIFKFTMDAMLIKIEDWDIRGDIIKGNQNQKLYHSFGSKNTPIKNEIIYKIQNSPNINDPELIRETEIIHK